MAYIKFKTHYTELVEHFLRLAVRHKQLTKEKFSTVLNWHTFTLHWIDLQSDEDKKFIQSIFDYQFRNTSDGLYHFEPTETLFAKRERLAKLEKQFSIDSGLYDESSDSEITA